MKAEVILKKVKTLVEMSGSTSNLEALQDEKMVLEGDRKKASKVLETIEQRLSEEENYFDPDALLADQQEKRRLEKRIERLSASLTAKQKELEDAKSEEETAHQHFTLLQKTVEELDAQIETVHTRIASATTSKNEAGLKHYEDVLAGLEASRKEQGDALALSDAEYQVICDRIAALSDEVAALQDELDEQTKTCEDLAEKIKDPYAYQNRDAKAKDQAQAQELEAKVAKIEARLSEIANDPVMLAYDIKIALDAEEIVYPSVLTLFESLVNIVKTKPYMDMTGANVAERLEQELADTTAERDALKAAMDAKDYTAPASDLAQKRVDDLEKRISYWNNEHSRIEKMIQSLDSDKAFHTRNLVEESKQTVEALRKSVAEYESVVASSENETPLRRANLAKELTSKKEELQIAENINAAYLAEQRNDILVASALESQYLVAMNNYLTDARTELEQAQKLAGNKRTTKDVIAEEKDRQELNRLSDKISAIKARMKFTETPDEILDTVRSSLLVTIEEAEPVLPPMDETTIFPVAEEEVALSAPVDFEVTLTPIVEEPEMEQDNTVAVEEPAALTEVQEPVLAASSELEESAPIADVPVVDVAPIAEAPVEEAAPAIMEPEMQEQPEAVVVEEPVAMEPQEPIIPASSEMEEPTPVADIPVVDVAPVEEVAPTVMEPEMQEQPEDPVAEEVVAVEESVPVGEMTEPALVETLETEPVAMETPVAEETVIPFVGFESESRLDDGAAPTDLEAQMAEPEAAQTFDASAAQELPSFEEPVAEVPSKQTYKVVSIMDIEQLHKKEESTPDATLEQGEEYIGFEDYGAAKKVA